MFQKFTSILALRLSTHSVLCGSGNFRVACAQVPARQSTSHCRAEGGVPRGSSGIRSRRDPGEANHDRVPEITGTEPSPKQMNESRASTIRAAFCAFTLLLPVFTSNGALTHIAPPSQGTSLTETPFFPKGP